MARHIYESKRLLLDTQHTGWLYYGLARRNGFSERRAKAWAIYILESIRQNGREPPHPTRYKKSKHARAKVFDRLITIPEPSLSEQAKAGLENFSKITGTSVEALGMATVDLEVYQDWCEVTRGRDLFIPGWGTFDIRQVLEATGCLCTPEGYLHPYSPIRVTSNGYFGLDILRLGRFSIESLKTGKDKGFREFVASHINDMKRDDRLYDIDQIVLAWEVAEYRSLLERLPNGKHRSLDNVLDRVRELEAERIRVHQVQRESMYVEPFPVDDMTLQEGDYELRVITHPKDLINTARAMHNCAGSYVPQCAEGEMLFVVAYRKDKPRIMGNLSNDNGVWQQILGPCNEQVSLKQRSMFTHNTDRFLTCFNTRNGGLHAPIEFRRELINR